MKHISFFLNFKVLVENKSGYLKIKIKHIGLVENKNGSSLKTLRINGKFEFNSNGFKAYCAHNEIKTKVLQHIPQQNGNAKHKYQTIVEMNISIF